MAVKALVTVLSAEMEEGGESMILSLRISIDHMTANGVDFFAIPLSRADALVNQDIMDFAKQYAIDTWNVTFDVGDTVRIVNAVNQI